MKRNKKAQASYYAMIAPGMIWLILFNCVPMVGVVMAFENFNPSKGFFGSKWIGLDNFKYLFSLNDAKQVIVNTLIIAIAKMILLIVVPLVFALLLNEVRYKGFKRTIQTIVYMPHFMSWVVLASIVLTMLGYDGLVNHVRGMFGTEPVIFMSDASFFRKMVIITDVWKEYGYNAVVYLAALTGTDPGLYEAAAIDGASRWKRAWHITLPCIRPTIVLLSVLGLGSILNAGFDQIFNMYNPLVYSTSDILDTWVYRIGLINLQYSLATTAGLFKSIVSFILIIVSYALAYKFADYRIF